MSKFGWNNVGEHLAGALGYTAASMASRRFFGRPINAQQRRDSLRYRMPTSRRARRPGGRALTYRRRKPRSVGGVLGGDQADTRLIYRKKRMPRRMRKRWVSFIRKVDAAQERELGTRTVLFNDALTQSVSSAGTQGCLTLALYPFVNTTNLWLNDMNQIGQMENEANPTAAAGATIYANSKVLFQSAIMDITIRNISTKRNTGVDEISPDASIELDIYELYMRKEPSTPDADTANWASITRMLNRYDDPDIGGTAPGIAISDRGASPFEFGSQMARAGIKVMKKTKFFIPNGQTITWQCRDPKKRVCRYGDLETNDGWVKPGWTKVFYLVYKLVPGLTQGSLDGNYKAVITMGITRKYSYKVEGFNEPRERLMGATYLPAAQE